MAMPFSEKIAVAEYFGKKNFLEVSTKVWENVFFESLKKSPLTSQTKTLFTLRPPTTF